MSIAGISSNPNWLSQLTGQSPLAAKSSTSSGSAAASGGTLLQNIISTLRRMLPGY